MKGGGAREGGREGGGERESALKLVSVGCLSCRSVKRPPCEHVCVRARECTNACACLHWNGNRLPSLERKPPAFIGTETARLRWNGAHGYVRRAWQRS